MNCDNCQADDKQLYLLPRESVVETWLCHDCLNKAGCYCANHDQVHAVFLDDDHACLLCVDDTIRELADRRRDIYDDIQHRLNGDEHNLFELWSAGVCEITGDDDRATALIRAVATYAARKMLTVDEVLNSFDGKISHILPSHFFL